MAIHKVDKADSIFSDCDRVMFSREIKRNVDWKYVTCFRCLNTKFDYKRNYFGHMSRVPKKRGK